MEKLRADVAVIGGGATGCSAAFSLARRGARVVLLEKGCVACEGSGRNAGGVRQQGRHPAELPLAMMSASLWPGLADEIGCDTEYRRKGNLWLALNEMEMVYFEELDRRHRAAGLATKLLSAAEAASMVPKLGADVRGAILCPIDGEANPLKTTFGLARAARRHGARLFEGCEVVSVLKEKGKAAGVQARGLKVEAPVVINAAGPWAGALCEMAGIEIPIRACRNHVCATQPIEDLELPFVLSSRVYLRQTARGNLLFGNVNPPDFVDFEKRNGLAINEVSACVGGLPSMFQALGRLAVVRSWAGALDLTPDDLPVIGEAPGLVGFYVAAGFSGHGFALAPAVGEVVAELAAGGEPRVSLGAFSPERFSSGGEPQKEHGEPVFSYGQALGKTGPTRAN